MTMATSSVLHSNATNFQSFVQNGVDQRTGQYTLAIDLKLPNGNDLIGPGLPLRLSYSPFNDQNSGFGTGWDLALTQYVLGTRVLSLHTGESYKVTGSGAQPGIREKKLDSFHFHDDSQADKQQYRVVHKTGLEEVLCVYGDQNPVALPSEVRAPSGHCIKLTYEPATQRLLSIVDGNGVTLLKIDYTDGRVTVDTHPGANGNGVPYLRHQLMISNSELVEVALPSELGGNWRFKYTTARGLRCLSKVSTPEGVIEEIRYGENQDPGHILPGTEPMRALPRVTSYVVNPRADQPLMTTTFSYKRFDSDQGIEVENNFVGSNSGIRWQDNGEDNLYRALASYEYAVTAHYWQDGKVVRKQTQTFNRHHLMTLQRLEQNGHIEETATEFHELPGTPFENQPAYFQLPRKIIKRRSIAGDPRNAPQEQATTLYDTNGNIIEEIQPSGVRVTYTYYSKGGEQGDGWSCPADPQGFVRNLKCKTVYPVKGHDGDAPVQRTRLSYKAYPALNGASDNSQWLAPCEEQVLQVLDADQPSEAELPLIRVVRGYLNQPDNAFLHGRPDFQATTRYGTDPTRRIYDDRTARIEWHYEKVTDPVYGLEYRTRETTIGFDNQEKTTVASASPLHGQTVYAEDDFGNNVRRYYDALARLVKEVIAPDNSEDSATITHGYTLVTHVEGGSAGLARQWTTSTTGVTTYQTLDGCSRVVIEERETAGVPGSKHTREKKTVAKYTYNERGQLENTTTFDYYPDRTLELTNIYQYDDWGLQCKVTLPTGVTLHSEFSPFGKAGEIVTTWLEASDRPGERQQLQVVEKNPFDKPSREYRLDQAGNEVSPRDYTYDGLGRCIRKEHNFHSPGNALVARVTEYKYDSEGRVIYTLRPDQSTVLSEFPLHSADALAEKLLVKKTKTANPILAWSRQYDGLERLSSMAAGLQKETYSYKANTSQVESRRTNKRSYTYHYRPTRSMQPERIETPTLKTTFDYDRQTTTVNHASNEQGTRIYKYTDQGYLLEATWQEANRKDYTCTYQTSLQGLPLGYIDNDGDTVVHEYNHLGQLEKTTQGSLVARFEYDTTGRLWKTLTADGLNKLQVLCEQTYDSLGREDTRRQTLTRQDGSTLTQEIKLKWREDDLLFSRTLSRDGQLQLQETFEYDALDRLDSYICSGITLPCNASGRAITSQYFVYDTLNNLSECYTDFADGKTDEAIYTYDGLILKEVNHTLQPDYPARQAFEHDGDGNLLNDEWGNKLVYDDHGRLSEVLHADSGQPIYRYRYDGHNDLVGARHEQATEVLRRYQRYQLSSTREDDLLTQYLYAGERPLGLQRPGRTADNRLFMTDAANSVLGECSDDGLHDATYTAYGESPDNEHLVGLLGFNGESRERALGWSLLGRGYRAYNPGLMRFHSPDAAAPEDAGINPYVYCGGNPVNWRDPSGHYGIRHSLENPYIPPIPIKPKAHWMSWLGAAIGAVFAVISIFTMPPAGIPVAFGLGAFSLAIDVISTAVSFVALATMDETLSDAAFWLGIASALSSLISIGYSTFKNWQLRRVLKDPPPPGPPGGGSGVVGKGIDTIPRLKPFDSAPPPITPTSTSNKIYQFNGAINDTKKLNPLGAVTNTALPDLTDPNFLKGNLWSDLTNSPLSTRSTPVSQQISARPAQTTVTSFNAPASPTT